MTDELKGKIIPITARTLESLIRIATAFAKARLSNKVERQDCENALELVADSIFHENIRENNYDDDNYMDLDEEEEDKSQKKSKKEKTLPLDEEEDEQSEEKSKKSKKHRNKKNKQRKELEELIEAQIDEGDDSDEGGDDNGKISEEQTNVIFKFIYDNAKKKRNQTISIDEMWNIIKGNKECKDKKILNKSKLVDICAMLEDEGKIFVSETKEITLV